MDQALTPAEALVLLDPDRTPGQQAAKVTLMALMAQGALRVQRPESRFTGLVRLSVANPPPSPPPHVAAVLEAVRAAGKGAVDDVARNLSKATDRYRSFVPAMILPGLVARGLLTSHTRQETRRLLLVFKRTVTVTTHTPTAAGEREQARLRQALDQAPEIRRLLDRDPARAAAMAAALGALIFLVPELLPLIDRLAGVASLPAAQFVTDSSGSDGEWSTMTEVNSAVDGALDAATSSGSDSDSGDGDSGDSGGSDGGGE